MKFRNLSLGLIASVGSCSVDSPLSEKPSSKIFDIIEARAKGEWCVMPDENVQAGNSVRIKINPSLRSEGMRSTEAGVHLDIYTEKFSALIHDRFRDGVMPTKRIVLSNGEVAEFNPYEKAEDIDDHKQKDQITKELRSFAIAAVRYCKPVSKS